MENNKSDTQKVTKNAGRFCGDVPKKAAQKAFIAYVKEMKLKESSKQEINTVEKKDDNTCFL